MLLRNLSVSRRLSNGTRFHVYWNFIALIILVCEFWLETKKGKLFLFHKSKLDTDESTNLLFVLRRRISFYLDFRNNNAWGAEAEYWPMKKAENSVLSPGSFHRLLDLKSLSIMLLSSQKTKKDEVDRVSGSAAILVPVYRPCFVEKLSLIHISEPTRPY